jgi:hypothetical protein
LFESLSLLGSPPLTLPSTVTHKIFLPIFGPLVAVRPVTKLPKLLAGLGLKNGLERLFKRFSGPFCAIPGLARQDIDRHVGHSLVFLHGLPLSVAPLGA